MTSTTVPLTANKLNIRPPARFWALALLISAAVLGAVLYERVPGLIAKWRELARTIDFDQISRLRDPQLIASMILLALVSLFALVAAIHVLCSFVAGVRRLFARCIPTGVPADLTSGRSVVQDLFRKRTIHFAGTQNAIGSIAPKLRYLTQGQRALWAGFGGSLVRWGLLIAMLSAPMFVPREYLARLHIAGTWPFPGIVILVGVFSLIAQALAAFASVQRQPRVSVHEQEIAIQNGSNPVDMFLQLRKSFEEVRYRNFPNREIDSRKPQTGRSRDGETDSFDAELILERQPEPASRGWNINAMILDVAGATLRCVGFIILLGLPLRLAELSASTIAPYAFTLMAGLAATASGSRLLALAFALHHIYRFHSDVYWLILEGTYSVGRSGIGDGRGGGIYAGRSQMQSRCQARLWATCVVSECSDLTGSRHIIDCRPDTRFQQRLQHIIETLERFEGEPQRLPSVDLADAGVTKIIQANARIEQLHSAARAAAQRPAALPTLEERPLLAAESKDGEFKTCPECAERVRRAARKCRYCEHRFADGVDEQTFVTDRLED